MELIAAERLDITLARPEQGGPVLLTNTGNGNEAFAVSAAGGAGAVIRGIAIDRDGDGRFDPARDTLLVDGSTPSLAPGASLQLLVLVDAPAAVTIVATATTGSGPRGTTFAGKGDGGGDAVTGETGARAELSITADAQPTGPTLLKSQSVAAPDGSARAIAGATVTYTLAASFPAAVADAQIDDPIPAGTAFVPGSLQLDDAVLNDAAGFNGRGVMLALGPQPAGSRRVLRFQVRIQ